MRGAALDNAKVNGAVQPALLTSNLSLTCMLRPNVGAAWPARLPRARSPMHAPMRREKPKRGHMRIELTVNGATQPLDIEPRTTLLDCLRDHSASLARMLAVSTVYAAPVPCWSTALPFAPV